MLYLFGDYILDTSRRELTRAGLPIALEPKAYQLLAFLVENHERLVTKQEVVAHVWPRATIDDASVRSCIRSIRQAVGGGDLGQTLIETRHGQGYRFLPEVRTAENAATEVNDSSPAEGETHENSRWPDTDTGAVLPDAPNSFLQTALRRAAADYGWKQPAKATRRTGLPAGPEVFLNSAFGVALAVREHPSHERARVNAARFRTQATRMITTRSVILEIYRAVTTLLNRDAALDILEALEEDPDIEVVSITDDMYARALDKARRENWGPEIDAVSRLIMSERGLTEALPETDPPMLPQAPAPTLTTLSRRQSTRRDELARWWIVSGLVAWVSSLTALILHSGHVVAGVRGAITGVSELHLVRTFVVGTAAVLAALIVVLINAESSGYGEIRLIGVTLSRTTGLFFLWLVGFVAIITAVAFLSV